MMFESGNLVVRDGAGNLVFQSGTDDHNGPLVATVQNNQLVLLNNGKQVWATPFDSTESSGTADSWGLTSNGILAAYKDSQQVGSFSPDTDGHWFVVDLLPAKGSPLDAVIPSTLKLALGFAQRDLQYIVDTLGAKGTPPLPPTLDAMVEQGFQQKFAPITGWSDVVSMYANDRDTMDNINKALDHADSNVGDMSSSLSNDVLNARITITDAITSLRDEVFSPVWHMRTDALNARNNYYRMNRMELMDMDPSSSDYTQLQATMKSGVTPYDSALKLADGLPDPNPAGQQYGPDVVNYLGGQIMSTLDSVYNVAYGLNSNAATAADFVKANLPSAGSGQHHTDDSGDGKKSTGDGSPTDPGKKPTNPGQTAPVSTTSTIGGHVDFPTLFGDMLGTGSPTDSSTTNTDQSGTGNSDVLNAINAAIDKIQNSGTTGTSSSTASNAGGLSSLMPLLMIGGMVLAPVISAVAPTVLKSLQPKDDANAAGDPAGPDGTDPNATDPNVAAAPAGTAPATVTAPAAGTPPATTAPAPTDPTAPVDMQFDGTTQTVPAVVAEAVSREANDPNGSDASAAYRGTVADERTWVQIDPSQLRTGDVMRWDHHSALIVVEPSGPQMVIDGHPVSLDTADPPDGHGAYGQFHGYFHPSGLDAQPATTPA